MNNLKIEKFGERLDAVVRCLIHETLIIGNETRNILSVNDIYEAMQAENKIEARTHRTWERALNGQVPREYLSFIFGLYPMVRGILEGPMDGFKSFISDKLAARSDWEEAMTHLALHRHERLNSVAKRYYTAVDETQSPSFPIKDFPLIAKSDWILDEPILLSDVDPVSIEPIQIDRIPSAPILDGVGITALALKSSVTLRKRKRKTGDAYWNGQTYRVRGINREGDHLRFEFGNATYFDYINCCEARALELSRADLKNPSELNQRLMPIRIDPSDIYNFLGRATFPGVNCLTFIKNYREPNAQDGEHDVYLVHFRDDTVMEAQNCVHVVPAGGHQPLSDDLEDRAASQIWRTAAREFLEELRGYKELDRHNLGKAGIHDDASSKDEFNILFRHEVSGKKTTNIYLLGVGIDPVTTKPEILVAIVMDWNRASQKIEGLRLINNYEGCAKPIRFRQTIAERKEQLRKEAVGFLHSPWGTPLPTLAAGAACFLLGAEHYEGLMA
jgi:hypothetical protein